MERILAPSILAADFKELGKQIVQVETAGAQYLHFDVMDGHFVPNISFGIPVLESINGNTSLILDAHLMVEKPERFVQAFALAGADILTVHMEACKDIAAILQDIGDKGMKRGLSLKPNTPVSIVEPYLEQVDMILIMTVEPGFGGQNFLPETLEKVKVLRHIITKRNLPIDIEVDGGIYHENVNLFLEAGANVIVAGSSVFVGNVKENVEKYLELFKRYE